MAVTIQGRSCSNDNIATGAVSGTERVILGSAAPAYVVENIQTGGDDAPVGTEKIATGVTGPNPEIP